MTRPTAASEKPSLFEVPKAGSIEAITRPGRGLALFFIVLFLGAVLIVTAPMFHHPPTRPMKSRAVSDMRSIAIAIESYWADFSDPPISLELLRHSSQALQENHFIDPFKQDEILPPNTWRNLLYHPVNAFRYIIAVTALVIIACFPSMREKDLPLFGTLLLYAATIFLLIIFLALLSGGISEYVAARRFSPWSSKPNKYHTGDEFHYKATAAGWAVISIGPDGDLDTPIDLIPDLFDDPGQQHYSQPYFYDPTNGVLSSGDIIRTGWGQLN